MLGLKSKTPAGRAVMRCCCGTVVSVPAGARLACPNGCGAILSLETDGRYKDLVPVADLPDNYPYPDRPDLLSVQR